MLLVFQVWKPSCCQHCPHTDLSGCRLADFITKFLSSAFLALSPVAWSGVLPFYVFFLRWSASRQVQVFNDSTFLHAVHVSWVFFLWIISFFYNIILLPYSFTFLSACCLMKQITEHQKYMSSFLQPVIRFVFRQLELLYYLPHLFLCFASCRGITESYKRWAYRWALSNSDPSI